MNNGSGFEKNALTSEGAVQHSLTQAYIKAYTNGDYEELLDLLRDSGNDLLNSSYLGAILCDNNIKNSDVRYSIILKLTTHIYEDEQGNTMEEGEEEIVTEITDDTKALISDNLSFIINSLEDRQKVSALYRLKSILKDPNKAITILWKYAYDNSSLTIDAITVLAQLGYIEELNRRGFKPQLIKLKFINE